MEVSIEVAPGELFDKVTILRIKLDRIGDAARRANVAYEMSRLAPVRETLLRQVPEAEALEADLQAVNERLWVIEDDIRDCERRKDFGEDFIRLARAVYVTNDERARLKRRINDLFGSRIVEEKSYAEY